MITITIAFQSNRKGAKQTGKNAYLALLTWVNGKLQREFISRTYKHNNIEGFGTALAVAGQVYEARRWLWYDGAYRGGTCWFVINEDGSGYPLSYDEAVEALQAQRLPAPSVEPQSVVLHSATRKMPDDIRVGLAPAPTIGSFIDDAEEI
jgi:hypothetical protein